MMRDSFDENTRFTISLSIAAYFEDVISCANLFRTFTRKHQELYGKYLPFYDTSEECYYDDEINLQDVSFIIWSILQKENKRTFLNPENPGIIYLAEVMYKVLDEEFERMPQNDYFLDYIRLEKHYADFFAFKKIVDWLFYSSFLFGFENSMSFKEQMENIENNSLPPDFFLYAVRSESMFRQKTGPLALPIKEWFATMLEGMGMEKEISIINAIESHASDYFYVNGMDENYFHVKDSWGEKYSILRSSFEKLPDKVFYSKILMTSLAKYNGEWYVNGLSVWSNEEKVYDDLVEKKKNEKWSRRSVYNDFIKANGGSPIAYFKNMSEVYDWFSKFLVVPESIEGGIKGDKEDFVVFASPETDLCIIPNIGCFIKDIANPFYDQKKAEDKGISLLVDICSCPSYMYHYLNENKKLPDVRINSILGEERGRELVRENVDFIARFFRWNNY